jgi:hypothetical protein
MLKTLNYFCSNPWRKAHCRFFSLYGFSFSTLKRNMTKKQSDISIKRGMLLPLKKSLSSNSRLKEAAGGKGPSN